MVEEIKIYSTHKEFIALKFLENDMGVDKKGKAVFTKLFNSEIETFFAIHSEAKRDYYVVGDIIQVDSTRIAILNTGILDDTIRQNIRKRKSASHFICQVSSGGGSNFVCDVYYVTHKMLKSSPSIFYSFKMIYTIDNSIQVKPVRFDKRVVM